jgi:hypothetical protein
VDLQAKPGTLNVGPGFLLTKSKKEVVSLQGEINLKKQIHPCNKRNQIPIGERR